jgi:hypothetical protein
MWTRHFLRFAKVGESVLFAFLDKMLTVSDEFRCETTSHPVGGVGS